MHDHEVLQSEIYKAYLGGIFYVDNNFALKQTLNQHDLQMVDSEFNKKKKSTAVTWILWWFLGGIGGHRYYLGYVGRGIAMTLTLGGLGIWSLIDAFFITGALRNKNDEIELEIIKSVRSFAPSASVQG